jgi:hypothetical protein
MVKLFVLVFRVILDLLQLADQSVLPALNVLKTKHVTTKNVSILALELVASMQDVRSETTILFAVALQDTPEILS